MKCAVCQYEHEEEVQGQLLITTKGDKKFIWLSRVNGSTDVGTSQSFNQFACPKCGTVQLEL